MLRPVGSLPPSVYWRRRLVLCGSIALLLVLLVLTVRAVASGSGTNAGAAGASSTAKPPPTSQRPKPTPKSTAPKTTASRSPKASNTTSVSTAPKRCAAADLDVSAVAALPSYPSGSQPKLMLQVINNGSAACVQNLADSEVELRVYNGESRVWGSHDCDIEKGTSDRTLAVGHAVRVSVTWSGLSSRKNCVGTRQLVGPGTYTLYAFLSGHGGHAAQFALT